MYIVLLGCFDGDGFAEDSAADGLTLGGPGADLDGILAFGKVGDLAVDDGAAVAAVDRGTVLGARCIHKEEALIGTAYVEAEAGAGDVNDLGGFALIHAGRVVDILHALDVRLLGVG